MTIRTDQKAVIYVRVSSAAQVAKGQGAESQAARCAEFARMKGYAVVKTFEDKAISGSLIDRPGMKALLSFLRQHRKDNVRVLLDDISRLARGLEAHLALRAAIAEAGGILESPSIEFGEDSDSQLIEHLLASVSAHARVKNAEQTRNRMEARMRSGYYTFAPPWGYKSEKREGHGNVLVRDEPLATIIEAGMMGMASGRFQTRAELARYFESQPDFPKTRFGTVTIETVNRILNRVVYAGMVERPEWGVSLRQGKHEGLIDFATFEKIQERLTGKTYAAARPDINAAFPLRGSVLCTCGKPLTAYFAKSKTGARHPYYTCFNKHCEHHRKSIRRADIEGQFEALLQSLEPSPALAKVAKAMFADAWEMQRSRAKEVAAAIKRSAAQADAEISKLLKRILSASSESVIAAYEQRIDQIEREKLVLTEKQQNAGKPLRPFGEMFELALRFLEKPANLWKSGRLEDRYTVIRLVFAGPLTYSRNDGLLTHQTSSVFKMLEAARTGNFKMAETEGFEPSIPLRVWFLSRELVSATHPRLRIAAALGGRYNERYWVRQV